MNWHRKSSLHYFVLSLLPLFPPPMPRFLSLPLPQPVLPSPSRSSPTSLAFGGIGRGTGKPDTGRARPSSMPCWFPTGLTEGPQSFGDPECPNCGLKQHLLMCGPCRTTSGLVAWAPFKIQIPEFPSWLHMSMRTRFYSWPCPVG